MRRTSYTQEANALLEARARNGDAAYKICEAFEAKLIALLQQKFGLSRRNAEELLRDLMREHERAVIVATRDHLHVDDAIDAVQQIFGDE